MLHMTYSKYIDNHLLFFIPGKVLDEIKNVLNLVENSNNPPRSHNLLQELRDLSSMAMEHFDEHILPRVREQMDRQTAVYACFRSPSNTSTSPLGMTHIILSGELRKIKKQNRLQKHKLTNLTQCNQKMVMKLRRQNLRLRAQSLKIREQERKLQEQTTKIQEQESTIADIKKHIDEWDQKYIDLTTELVRARDDILSKTCSPSKTLSSSSKLCSQPKFYKPNIKPRVAQPKICTSLHSDLERKRKSESSSDDIPSKLLVYEPGSLEEKSAYVNEYSVKEPFKDRNPYKSLADTGTSYLNPLLAKNNLKPSRSGMISGSSQVNDLKTKKDGLASLVSSAVDAVWSTSNIKSRKRKFRDD